MNDFLILVKKALRITTNYFDEELTQLVNAALIDLGFGGAREDVRVVGYDAIINQAVITYVKMNFGIPEDYDRLKKSYDEQKAQLGMATNYTEWGKECTTQ